MSAIAAIATGVITAYLGKNVIEVGELPTLVSDVTSALQKLQGESPNPSVATSSHEDAG